MSTLDPPFSDHLQEDELTPDQNGDFISSLPTAGFLSQYRGFWITTRSMQGVLSLQKHFQAQETDIQMMTPPKVGTTWLKAILFAIVNRKHNLDLQKHPLLTNNPHILVPYLDLHFYNQKEVPDLTFFPSPRLFSAHLPYTLLPTSVKHSTCKIVHLYRNPKDTFVSLWHFLKNNGRTTDSFEGTFDEFCQGVSSFGPYWDHVLNYWKESLEKPQKILCLRYEELKEQPSTHLKKIAEFLECPFSSEEETKGMINDILRLCSFDYLNKLEVNKSGTTHNMKTESLFRLGEVGDWVNYLTPQMSKKLDDIFKEKFHGTGLTCYILFACLYYCQYLC
ncbi:cytosolic sulfotransferase 5-like [Carya illinoinensis]|uniref:Sulfotransferase n=1 Tax=Carya illinoinensis TaxID=32201 RepID=A0A8T1QFH7_CARIL|nr:cytosolic sulfotransferase 5-like [Carya illinoinensis]KAG6653031.1 hypothetical protein CIPAW_05G046400 [Carya illinoinensis]